MSGERLTPTSYAVLGMVALRGPTTPYDLVAGDRPVRRLLLEVSAHSAV